MDRDEEEELLKKVVLRNSQSIRATRLRAEQELIQTKEALARKVDELAKEREWLRVLLTSIGDAVITTDVEGNITFLNPEAQLLTGWSLSESLGLPLERIFNIVDQETRQVMSNRVVDVLRKGSSAAQPRYVLLIARNGLEAVIEDSVTPVRNADESVIGTIMVFRDMSERLRK